MCIRDRLEALGGSATSASQKKIVAELQAAVDDLKPKVEALVGQWNKQKSATDNLQKTKQAIQEQSSLLEAAETKGDVAKSAEIRYGSLKYLEQQREDLEKQLSESAGTQMVPDTVPVSYTHLDVYKRQRAESSRGRPASA